MEHTYRDDFPVTADWAFLDHANVAPISRRAYEQVERWVRDTAANGGASIDRWVQVVESVRGAAARLISADPADVAFLASTSQGLALVAEGFPWQQGDVVVVAEGGVSGQRLPLGPPSVAGRSGQDGALPRREDLARRPRTADRCADALALDQLRPVRDRLPHRPPRRRGVVSVTEHRPLCGRHPRAWGVPERRAGHAHRLPRGEQPQVAGRPPGAAIFAVNPSKLEKIRPTSVGWKSVVDPYNYSKLDFMLKNDASRFEAGSFLIPSIVGLGGGVPHCWRRFGVRQIGVHQPGQGRDDAVPIRVDPSRGHWRRRLETDP